MKRKVMTILGTRPEIIRLSEIIKKVDTRFDHVLVHTGQNFNYHLSEQLFIDLELRQPDYLLNRDKKCGITFVGTMLCEVEEVLKKERPEAVLILGDTNSALSAYVCRRMQIPVFHLEAGNRCFSDDVPEEMNRKVIDSLSTYLLPYTGHSKQYLLREGYHPRNIVVTGNPIVEVFRRNEHKIVTSEQAKPYVLVTLHRDENVTDKNRLSEIIAVINQISQQFQVVFSVHPKLEAMLKKHDISLSSKITHSDPIPFFTFLGLEKEAVCVLTDSGTNPEECSIFGTPCLLLRNSTERPELLENNSMILAGIQKDSILDAFEVSLTLSQGSVPEWYRDADVSEKIVKLLFLHFSRAHADNAT